MRGNPNYLPFGHEHQLESSIDQKSWLSGSYITQLLYRNLGYATPNAKPSWDFDPTSTSSSSWSH